MNADDRRRAETAAARAMNCAAAGFPLMRCTRTADSVTMTGDEWTVTITRKAAG